MKSFLQCLGVFVLTLLTLPSFSQAPNAFNYQAVLRNSGGEIIENQAVTMRFSIRNNTASGPIQYQETRNITTNEFGMVNHAIGTGTVVSGIFGSITWASGVKFLQVELNTGGGFVNLGAEQLRSVPYALSSGDNLWSLNGNYAQYPNEEGGIIVGASSAYGRLRHSGTSGNFHLDSFQGGIDLNWFSGDRVTIGNGNQGVVARFAGNGNTGLGTDSPMQRLDVNGRVNVANGVIQRGGAAITATNDLGLYSRVEGNFMRFSTNGGQIKFYTSEGTNGIGEDNGGEAFEINADAGDANGHLRIFNSSGDASLICTVNNFGQIGTDGNRFWRIYNGTYFGVNSSIQALSDRSLKKNVLPLNTGLNAIMQLRPVSYDFIIEKLYKNEDARNRADARDVNNQMGFIAQELEQVLPGLIREIEEEDGTELKTVGYSNLIPVLVKGMQEQQSQIEAQQAQIEELTQLVLELSKK